MTFAIDIPPELVARAVTALAEAGVDLRPQRDLINYDPDAPDRPRRGTDLPHLVREINELLAERGQAPLIPSFNDRWSLERRNQMLQLAVNEFTWDHYRIDTVLWERRQQPWADVAAEYPLVFAQRPVTRQNLRLELPSRVFDTDQDDQAEDLARRTDSVVYTWKTAAGRHWLEQGLQTTDALGLTLLPPGLPSTTAAHHDQKGQPALIMTMPGYGLAPPSPLGPS